MHSYSLFFHGSWSCVLFVGLVIVDLLFDICIFRRFCPEYIEFVVVVLLPLSVSCTRCSEFCVWVVLAVRRLCHVSLWSAGSLCYSLVCRFCQFLSDHEDCCAAGVVCEHSVCFTRYLVGLDFELNGFAVAVFFVSFLCIPSQFFALIWVLSVVIKPFTDLVLYFHSLRFRMCTFEICAVMNCFWG